MRRALAVVAVLAVALAAGAAVLVAGGDRPWGIATVWSLAGPADQGPVDFATLARRSSPNDALVCPPRTCAAVPDVAAPVYAMPAPRLRELLKRAILATPGTVQVAEAAGSTGDRFVVRTPLLRFPDTVDLVVLPLGDTSSTFALYSRSLVGWSDLGENLRRIRTWMGAQDLALLARPASG